MSKVSYLVTLEFRYNDKRPNWSDSSYEKDKTTLGLVGTVEEACKLGNTLLEHLESLYPLNPNYNIKKRFTDGNQLITDLGYMITPFQFFVSIRPLPLLETTDDIAAATKRVQYRVQRYAQYKIDCEEGV